MSIIALVRNAANHPQSKKSVEYRWNSRYDWLLWDLAKATTFTGSKVPERMDEIWARL